MTDLDLDIIISARINKDVVKEARRFCVMFPDRYENFSHYVRVSLMKLNNEHKKEVQA